VPDFANPFEDEMVSDKQKRRPAEISVDGTQLKVQATALGFLDDVWQSSYSNIKAKSSEKLAQFHRTIIQKASYLRGNSSFDQVLDEWLNGNYETDQLQQLKFFYLFILRGFIDSSDLTRAVDEDAFRHFGPILSQTYVVLKDGAISYTIGNEPPRVGDMTCIAQRLKCGFVLRKSRGYWEYIGMCDLLHSPLPEHQRLLKNAQQEITII
jgi:hypothetical protein